jgi:hypothetical protein
MGVVIPYLRALVSVVAADFCGPADGHERALAGIGRIAAAVARSFAADADELHASGRVVIRQRVSGRQHEDCTDESSA